MKTTIDIADPLFERARQLADREGTTLRALVEQGLRQVLAQKSSPRPFKLRDARYRGGRVGGSARSLRPVAGTGSDGSSTRMTASDRGRHESPRSRLPTECPVPRGLAEAVRSARVTGPLIHDARIAALCRVHGVRELWTADRDFGRFPGLVLRNPLVPDGVAEAHVAYGTRRRSGARVRRGR